MSQWRGMRRGLLVSVVSASVAASFVFVAPLEVRARAVTSVPVVAPVLVASGVVANNSCNQQTQGNNCRDQAPATTAAPAPTPTTSPASSSGGTAGSFGIGGTVEGGAAPATTTTLPKIAICHATGDATNPYVRVLVDPTSLDGHRDHADDVIPAPAGGCSARSVARVRAVTTTSLPRTTTICHATGSPSEPYVEVTVNIGDLGEHATHTDDIIPAPAEGCSARSIRRYRATTTTAPQSVRICHATGRPDEPYVEISVSALGLDGHGSHSDDIIPAPAAGCGRRAIREARAATVTTLPRTIDICHRTGNAANPYVKVTVNADDLSGHADHDGDIVPAPVGGCDEASVSRAFVTTTTQPAGSLRATQSQLNDVRNGGQQKDLYQNLVFDATKNPRNQDGGSIEIAPQPNSPAVQLLAAKSSDPRVKITIQSTGSDYADPLTWRSEGFGSYCWKLEQFSSTDFTYVLPSVSAAPDATYAGQPYTAVIVRAASIAETDRTYKATTVFMNPAPGFTVFADANKNGTSDPAGKTPNRLGDTPIKFVILCVGESEYPDIGVSASLRNNSDDSGGQSAIDARALPFVAFGSGSGIRFELSATEDLEDLDVLEVEMLLTSGEEYEELVLPLVWKNFEPVEPYVEAPLAVLPETGTARWTTLHLYGAALMLIGFAMFAVTLSRRPHRR